MPDKIRTIATPDDLTEGEAEQVSALIDWALSRVCDKPCVANVDGKCAAKRCEGAIARLPNVTKLNRAEAMWAYEVSKASLRDYFGEEATP